MKAATVTLLATLGAATLASAQISGLPTCAATCFATQIGSLSCSSSDVACICGSTGFLTTLSECIFSSCSSSDQQTAISAAQSLCAAAGVSLDASAIAASATAAASSVVASAVSASVTDSSSVSAAVSSAVSSAVSAVASASSHASGAAVATSKASSAVASKTSSAATAAASSTGSSGAQGVAVGAGAVVLAGLVAMI
ncbi:hypothetical protein YB2330_000408 [Saitoella coloradoensis]